MTNGISITNANGFLVPLHLNCYLRGITLTWDILGGGDDFKMFTIMTLRTKMPALYGAFHAIKPALLYGVDLL